MPRSIAARSDGGGSGGRGTSSSTSSSTAISTTSSTTSSSTSIESSISSISSSSSSSHGSDDTAVPPVHQAATAAAAQAAAAAAAAAAAGSPYVYSFMFGGPSDKDRIVLQHELVKYMARGRLLFSCHETVVAAAAPVILDIGCGPGAWVRDVARAYPHATVYGVDISDAVLALAAGMPDAPPNVRLVHGDAAQVGGLPLPDASVDAARIACMVSTLPRAAYAAALRELRRVLKPGGAVELVEPYQPPLPKGPCISELFGI
ncbi:hypothetical protein HK405_011429, partial [Cladochytrium tenue]